MVLHLISQSPHAGNALRSCLRCAAPGHMVLLMADGVYAARASQPQAALLQMHPRLQWHALEEDLLARGLTELLPEIQRIDWDGFVKLVEACPRVLSWY